MDDAIKVLHNEYDVLSSAHREEECLVNKRKLKVTSEVENWLQKYDTDMGNNSITRNMLTLR